MKKYIFLSVIFLLIFSLMVGCAPARRVDPDNDARDQITDPQNNNPDNVNPYGNNNNNIQNGVPNDEDDRTLPRDNDRNVQDNNNVPGDDQARARRVADIASEVQGVNNATVVVTGDTAYVGIDMKANAEDQETNRLKEIVGERVKEKEATIDRVFVSADADTVTRLRKIGTDIRNGRPISGFLDELTEMFRRPAPSAE